jgi:hypothetical protein
VTYPEKAVSTVNVKYVSSISRRGLLVTIYFNWE